jgi:hypothetical protein
MNDFSNKDKEIQSELFEIDSKEMDELKVEFNKRKKEHKKQLRKATKRIEEQNQATRLAASLKKEKQRIRLISKKLKKIANSKINSLEPVILEELKKQDLSILPKDIIHIMTLLAFSRTALGEGGLAIGDVTKFFDEQGNFLDEIESTVEQAPNTPMKINYYTDICKSNPYDPFSCLYGWLEYIERDTLVKLGREKYLNQKLDELALYNFQFEILLEMLNVILGEMANEAEFPDFPPQRRSDRQRMLKITQLVYSSEFKKLLQSTTEFIDDKNGPHIYATNENGILTIKLNHKLRVYAGDFYERESTILNFINGGLLLQAFGKFTYKTPKNLHIFLEHDPTLFNGPARISTGMRWNDPRTKDKTREDSKRFRETSNEYDNRHENLAYTWNDGLFGPFSYECHEIFTTFKWKYPDFFKLDSIEDIQNDSKCVFSDLLDTYEGIRYPQVPHDIQLNSHEL